MGKLVLAGSTYYYDPQSADYPPSGNALANAVPFAGTLDANGELAITLADADTYDVTAAFQQDTTFGSSLIRFNHTDTAALHIKSSSGSADSGKAVAGSYWPKP